MNLNSNKPIGIFDSGIGGLTVMAEVMRLLPHEDIIYFGDTAHVPYGSKSSEAVTAFSMQIAKFLADKQVKMIVVACNTASAFALQKLRKKYSFPVAGVIEPGAKAALSATCNNNIGVIGTEGTIKSLSYKKAIKRLDGRTKVVSAPCPLLVPLVEEGWLNHPVTLQIAREYLRPLMKERIDTLVLGCTHYPLVKPAIRKIAGTGITLIDSATATALEVAATLQGKGISCNRSRKGTCRFFVSDAPQKFRMVGQKFLGRRISSVKKVVLDK